ncbi:neprilysin-2-like [Venturia canescens]|uniref:neprilysin-2-like n=1 Tax=Venturia canescens TaxID=32260 RepID=UPI001C9C8025|nr:neprilysin-2-like [Venturia canescens]
MPWMVLKRKNAFIFNAILEISGSHKNLCVLPGYIHTASLILKNMDPKVDPCDNFYRYACGGFVNRTIVSDEEPKVNYQTILEKKIRDWVKYRLQTEVGSDEPRHFKLAKNLYNICMNETAIAAAGLEPLRAQLNKLGGWPVVLGDAWNESEFNWTDTIYKFRDAGYPHNNLIHVGFIIDPKNNSKLIINIDQGTSGYYHDFVLLGLKDGFDRYNYMVNMAVKLGADRTRAEKEVSNFVSFEIWLENIRLTVAERRNKTRLDNLMKLKKLTETYPSIPWREYFRRLLPASITVGDDEIINVSAPSYFTKLENLLGETDKRMLANYLMWRIITYSKRYLDAGSTLTDPESRARSDLCYDIVFEQFPLVVAATFVRKYISKEAKERAIDIVKDVKRQFEVVLKDIAWMDERARRRALKKVEDTALYVGYPDELLDDEKLGKYYEKLKFPGDDYLESVLSVRKFSIDSILGKLREPVNGTRWTHPERSLWVDPLYLPEENSLLIPAGILQGVFFEKNQPNYMNYGAIGFVAGSGMSQAFDTTGKQFNERKNSADWWSPETEERYRQSVQCLTEQYGNYTLSDVGINLDGVSTLNENIANNGGIRIAYLAYKSWIARNKAEARLPGIDRTPEQMFWLSAANAWCAKHTEHGLISATIGNIHGPEEFRIIGAFSNMPEFADDYQCPVGSKMNPEKKCSVW